MDAFSLIVGLAIGLLLGALVAATLLNMMHRTWSEKERTLENQLRETRATLAAHQSRSLQAQENERQENHILSALTPLGERLNRLQQQVGLLERDRVEQYGQLAEQLRQAQQTDALLLEATHAVASSLKSTSARGHWGELQLHRVIEAAGMLPWVDFTEQAQRLSDDGVKRPDVIVHLPENREVFIDAKVPLSAHMRAQTSNDPQLAQEHAKALRAHITSLAAKQYWRATTRSPELVICFLPAESLLSAALTADPQLLDEALGRGVLLASPATLLGTLKAIALGWKQSTLAQNAQDIVTEARELHERLATLGEHLNKLGNSLRSSVERYNSAIGSFESRVLPTARKLSTHETDELPAPKKVDATTRFTGSPPAPVRPDPDSCRPSPSTSSATL